MKTFSMRAAIFTALWALLLCGCIEDGKILGTRGAGTPVTFASTIAKTRAYNDVWEVGDRIGVYMLPAGTADWSDTELLAENAQYGHDLEADDREAVFSGIGEDVIFWPDEGKVDFVAYYPYKADGISADYLYPVDIANQSVQKNIDLLYSDDVTRQDASSGSPALGFEHKLVKLIFNVIDEENDTPLDDLEVKFDLLPTTADFDLAAGEIVEGSEDNVTSFNALMTGLSDSSTDGDGIDDEATFEAIVLPCERLDYTVTFTLADDQSAVFEVEEATYDAGFRYIYNITLKPREQSSIEFGAVGSLSSIDDWGNGGKTDEDVPKNGPGGGTPASGLGEVWNSGMISDPGVGYTVDGDGTIHAEKGWALSVGNNVTIVKNDYDGGIVSVTVTIESGDRASAEGEIESVKVGDEEFVYDNNGALETSVQVSRVTPSTAYTFRSRDGEPVSGEIEIIVSASGSTIYVNSFQINSDIP